MLAFHVYHNVCLGDLNEKVHSVYIFISDVHLDVQGQVVLQLQFCGTDTGEWGCGGGGRRGANDQAVVSTKDKHRKRQFDFASHSG